MLSYMDAPMQALVMLAVVAAILALCGLVIGTAELVARAIEES